MFLPGFFCLFLALPLSGAVGVKDEVKALRMKAIRPGEPESTGETLQQQFTVDLSRAEFQKALNFKIYYAPINRFVSDQEFLLLEAQGSSIIYQPGMQENFVASITEPTDKNVQIDVTWSLKTLGYCASYLFTVDGLDLENEDMTIYHRFKVQRADGSTCRGEKTGSEDETDEEVSEDTTRVSEVSEKLEQCSVSPEEYQANRDAVITLAQTLIFLPAINSTLDRNAGVMDNLCTQVQEMSETAQNNTEDLRALEIKASDLFDEAKEKLTECRSTYIDQARSIEKDLLYLLQIFSLNTAKYDISSLYKERVYIVSKDKPNFDLNEMNELCGKSNGYLVELDDEDEMKFVGRFVESLDNAVCATGGNDVDNEGHFVYYTSKKPVPDDMWLPNEPSNSWGNENCVQVTSTGLNDMRCGFPYKYVCEIPLRSDLG